MPIPTSEQFYAYTTTHEQIATTIAGLTLAQLQNTPSSGEWSIQQVLIHLADSEVVGYERIRRVIAEDQSLLQLYDEAAWGSNLLYHQQDPQLALDLFRLLRLASASLLRLLPADTWERSGMHPVNGEMSLYTLFLTYLDHGAGHLRQIENARQSL